VGYTANRIKELNQGSATSYTQRRKIELDKLAQRPSIIKQHTLEPEKPTIGPSVNNFINERSSNSRPELPQTPASKINQQIRGTIGNAGMTGLDLLGRPGNAVVNTLKESGNLKQPEFARVDGKLYRTDLSKEPEVKKDLGGAFIRGITGQDRPEPLEMMYSKKRVEEMRQKDPVLTGVGNFAFGTVTDPTIAVGGGAIKGIVSRFAKGAKVASKAEDVANIERQVQNIAENEMADELLKGAKEVPKFRQYADSSIVPQVTYEALRKPVVYAGGEIGEKVDIVKKPVLEFESAKPQTPKTETKPIGEELPKPINKVVMDTPKNKFSFKKAWDKFYTRTVNTQKPISDFSRKTGDNAATLASNSRNSGGTIDYILKDALVDRQGNKIGKSLREVAEQIPKGQEEDFWNYMMQRHNIDRAREEKNVIPNYTSEMSEQAVKNIEAVNPGFKTVGNEVTNWIDTFMREWGVKAGTVDEAIYNDLRQTYKSYFPTQREFSQLERSIPEGTRKQFVDQNSPLRKATVSERDVNNPLENIMNLVNRNVKTARYNEVGQSFLNSVRQAPDKLKELAEVIPAQEGMFANTDNVISVLENGKPVYLRINNKELLDALKGLPNVVNNAKAMRAVTNVFKGLITQKNPLFAVRNIFRDIPTAYVYGSEANPFKFGAGLLKAGKDILTNGESFQRYRAVGGGGANFFKGDAVKSARELNKGGFHPLKAIETFNNLTETAPRLAEFNRVLEKTGDVQKALAAANDVTVNFARGGDVAKAFEAYVPYLNAGVQGLDKFFRGFKNPRTAIATLAKGGVAITAPEIALYLINKDDPNYQALDNRTKDTYYLIGKGDGTFWKIPKSRELGVLFGSLFQRALRTQNGEKNAWEGFDKTATTNFAPANPFENNFFSPLYGLKANKDFAGRNIVPQGMIMDKRSPYLQYDEKTTEIAKAIGEYSRNFVEGGLSPKQIDYLIKSYTGVIGQMGMPLATIGGDPFKSITTQFISDPAYSNQATQDFYENYNKLQAAATDKNITEQLPTNGKGNIVTPEEKLRNQFGKASEEISTINKEIRAIEASAEPDKEAKVRALRQKILDIANAANNMLK
jgi:hypothetical protein